MSAKLLAAKHNRLITLLLVMAVGLLLSSNAAQAITTGPNSSGGTGTTTNSSTTAGGSCSYTNTTFFVFPVWYAYVPGEEQTITSDNGQTSSACLPNLSSLGDIWKIVAAVIEILLRLAGIGAVFMVIYGGVKYTTSMGNPEDTAQARRTIIYSLVGLLLAISAAFLVSFVATSFSSGSS